MESEDAAELVRRIRQGDAEAENDFVRQFRGRIRAMAVARTRDHEAASELVNDSLMATLISLRKGAIREPAKLAAFVYQTSLNIVNNYLRTRARRPQEVELDDDLLQYDPRRSFETMDLREKLERIVSRMKAEDYRILTLSLVSGLNALEISTTLGIKVDAVRQRKSRILKKLRIALGLFEDDHPHGSQGIDEVDV